MIQMTEEERAFKAALDMAMEALRWIADHHPVCPRCFLEMLVVRIETMIDEGRGPDHSDEDELDELGLHGPIQGHA